MATVVRRIGEKADPAWQARVDLAAAHRLANRNGFDDGIWNHFTLMVPGTTDRFLVKPHGVLMSEVTAANLLVSDFEGNIVDGRGEIERTAYCIHMQIHRLHPHGACVLHCHPYHATWLGMTEPGRLLPIHQDHLHFQGEIAYDDAFMGSGSNLEEGERMARAAGDKRILLSGGHGVTVMAPTVAEAWYDLYYFERACRAQYSVMISGQKPRMVAERIVQLTKSRSDEYRVPSAHMTYEALKRDLDRDQGDYKG